MNVAIESYSPVPGHIWREQTAQMVTEDILGITPDILTFEPAADTFLQTHTLEYLGVTYGEDLAGFMAFQADPLQEMPGDFHIAYAAVAAAYRGKGFLRTLHSAVLQEAADRGATHITTYTIQSGMADSLRRYGYAPVPGHQGAFRKALNE